MTQQLRHNALPTIPIGFSEVEVVYLEFFTESDEVEVRIEARRPAPIRIPLKVLPTNIRWDMTGGHKRFRAWVDLQAPTVEQLATGITAWRKVAPGKLR